MDESLSLITILLGAFSVGVSAISLWWLLSSPRHRLQWGHLELWKLWISVPLAVICAAAMYSTSRQELQCTRIEASVSCELESWTLLEHRQQHLNNVLAGATKLERRLRSDQDGFAQWEYRVLIAVEQREVPVTDYGQGSAESIARRIEVFLGDVNAKELKLKMDSRWPVYLMSGMFLVLAGVFFWGRLE